VLIWNTPHEGPVCSFDEPSFYITIGFVSCDFDGIGYYREGGEYVSELFFGQAVEMGDQTIEFGAELSTLYRVSYSVLVAAQAHLRCQIIELGSRAGKPGGALYDGG